MAVQNFNLELKDISDLHALTHILKIDDISPLKCVLDIDSTSTNRKFPGDDCIDLKYRFDRWEGNFNGKRIAYYFGKYIGATSGTEFTQDTISLSSITPSDFSQDHQNWTREQIAAMLANELIELVFVDVQSKRCFEVDGNQKPVLPLNFIHPTMAKIESTAETAPLAADGTITITPIAGTGPFEVRIDGVTWVPVVGDFHTFTGLTAGGGTGGSGEYIVNCRDDSSPKIAIKPKSIFL